MSSTPSAAMLPLGSSSSPLRLVGPRGSRLDRFGVCLTVAIGNGLAGGQWPRITPCLESGPWRASCSLGWDWRERGQRGLARCLCFCAVSLGSTGPLTPGHRVTEGHRAPAATVQAAVLHGSVRPPMGELAIARGAAETAAIWRRNRVHVDTVHPSSVWLHWSADELPLKARP